MSGLTPPAAQAEIAKLARLLDVDPEELAYLGDAAAEDLRAVREQATDALFDADRRVLERIAAAGRILPAGAVAAIGERAFGPLLCARIAGVFDTGQAIDVAARLPADFLARIAVHLDPRRAADIVAGIPADRVVEVGALLSERGEHVAMGRFVGHLDDGTLVRSVETMDDRALLRTAFVLEGDGAADRVAALLDDERLAGVIRVAAEDDLWIEVLAFVERLGDEQRRRLAEIAERQDPHLLDGLFATADEHGLEEVLTGYLRRPGAA